MNDRSINAPLNPPSPQMSGVLTTNATQPPTMSQPNPLRFFRAFGMARIETTETTMKVNVEKKFGSHTNHFVDG